MTILESLREKRDELFNRDLDTTYNIEDYSKDLEEVMLSYDLALENALLKLKNRGVQISDLKNRINELEEKENNQYREAKRQGRIDI